VGKKMSQQKPLFEIKPKWVDLWKGMPEFSLEDLTAFKSVIVHFATRQDQDNFSKLVNQKITDRTQSIWYPQVEIGRYANKKYQASTKPKLRYPVYIPSKGRADTRYTNKAFEKIGLPHFIVIEPQEYDKYAEVVDPLWTTILTLPFRDRGLVPTRNWIWDHAEASGVERFWTFDDNIYGLYRFNNNLKVPVSDATILTAIENFTDRYKNLTIAGCNYFMFASRKAVCPPITFNTRVYSNMLIQTAAKDSSGKPFRNEGFFNDDTDLCLRILKDGQCTALFNAFLIKKAVTMTVKGGLTGHYQGDGRYQMAKELADKHPDVTKITQKWGRWQHHVNYKVFAKNELILRPDVIIPEGIDNYGMELQVYE
jgi:hypothetical protein